MHPFLDLSPSLGDVILSLNPTAYWPLDDNAGALRDAVSNRYPATVAGSPTYGVAAPSPLGQGITWSGTGQYATTSGSVPTPSASMSVLCFVRTTDATASNLWVASRYTSSTSWGLWKDNSQHRTQFSVYQSGGGTHASAGIASGSVNTGAWTLMAGTFDGTTIRVYQAASGAVVTNSSASLTGSWLKSSTAGIEIAARATTSLYIGTQAHVAYFNDRVLTAAEVAYINSVARGA